MKNKEHNVCLFIVKEKLFVTSSTAASTDIFLLHGANGERSGRGGTRTASKMQKTLENCAGLIFKTCSAGAQSSTAVSKLTCVVVQFPPGTAALRTQHSVSKHSELLLEEARQQLPVVAKGTWGMQPSLLTSQKRATSHSCSPAPSKILTFFSGGAISAESPAPR